MRSCASPARSLGASAIARSRTSSIVVFMDHSIWPPPPASQWRWHKTEVICGFV
jgi:hypothetical protein